MSNNIEITVGANETASDALGNVGKAANKAATVVVQSMGTTEAAFDTAARGSGRLGDALDKAEGATGKLGEGVSGVGEVLDTVSDLMNHSARKAIDLARAQTDVAQAANDAKQATEDFSQANRDSAQAGLDSEQARIDETQALVDLTKATKDYHAAVKEFGKDSVEARQASVDMRQAQLDYKQALEDGNQAQRDAAQAEIDKTQSLIDQKSAATDLTEAMAALSSQNSTLSQTSDWVQIIGGSLGGLSAAIGMATTVQWLWNAAMTANPIGLLIVGIALIVAGIVLLATKTQFFQTIWKAIWGKIGEPVKAAWAWVKNATTSTINWFTSVWKAAPGAIGAAFRNVASFLTAPFRAAFNGIAWAWNNTIGRLHFSIPSWVPGIGGYSFNVPNIPSLAVGGDVLKSGLAYIHQGERVTTAADAQRYNRDSPSLNSHSEPMQLQLSLEVENILSGNKLMDGIVEGIQLYVKNRGGNVQVALGRGAAS